MPRFELVEGKSSKFWEVEVAGSALTVRFGRIGTGGQAQTKSFASAAQAEAERDKLIREKAKKGYRAVAPPAASAGEDDAKAPAVVDADAEAPAPGPGTVERPAPPPAASEGFLDAGGGYAVALRDGKIVCRSPRGALLSSVPKEVRGGAAHQQLEDLRTLLVQQDRLAVETVETWMLRSLPVPRAALAAVWEDASWRGALENAVVTAGDVTGFFRGVQGDRLGVVDLDGETRWLEAESLRVPHPVLLDELDDLRGLASELGFTQGIGQLLREVYRRPAVLAADATAVSDYLDGRFQQLNHALSRCRKLGFRVRGGSAIRRVYEPDREGGLRVQEARYWIGAGEPTVATATELLWWVDERERTLPLAAVGPVAWSEGVRMAASIYAGRHVEKEAAGG